MSTEAQVRFHELLVSLASLREALTFTKCFSVQIFQQGHQSH